MYLYLSSFWGNRNIGMPRGNVNGTIPEPETSLLGNTKCAKYTYHFVRDARASWRSAQDHCRQLGGQLYIVNTRDHWMTLMDSMLNAAPEMDYLMYYFVIFVSDRLLDLKVCSKIISLSRIYVHLH